MFGRFTVGIGKTHTHTVRINEACGTNHPIGNSNNQEKEMGEYYKTPAGKPLTNPSLKLPQIQKEALTPV